MGPDSTMVVALPMKRRGRGSDSQWGTRRSFCLSPTSLLSYYICLCN